MLRALFTNLYVPAKRDIHLGTEPISVLRTYRDIFSELDRICYAYRFLFSRFVNLFLLPISWLACIPTTFKFRMSL